MKIKPIKNTKSMGARGSVSFEVRQIKPPKDVCIATNCGSNRKPVIVAPRGHNKHDPRFQPERNLRPAKEINL